MPSNNELLDWIDNELNKPTGADVIKQAPGLTALEAYRLQVALAQRRVSRGGKGEALIGYKIAGGHSGIRQDKEEARGEPVVGSLLRSGLVDNGGTYAYAGVARVVVEAECAIMINRDLQGPGLRVSDVLAAVEGYFAAIEIVPQSGSGARASLQHRILSSKFSGGIVLGAPLTPKQGLDLKFEGAIMSVNGEPRAAGTGVNIMGNPLIALADIANRLAAAEVGLKAGQVFMTGTITGLTPVAVGDVVEAGFTRLGRAGVRITA
jgi:2-keto-4-pentenoate hydratase